ncbi:peptidylprolyl isomerase [Chloroflexota bacterium]
MKRMVLLLAALVLITSAAIGCGGGKMAEEGNTVQVHYRGTLADGSVFDSSAGKDPLEFTIGANQVVTGFDKAVRGMKVGDKKTVTLTAAEAYGPRNEELVFEVDKSDLPEGMDPKPGDQLQMTAPSGSTTSVVITEVGETTVTIDANFFLAGKDLTFEIEMVDIQ